MTPTFKDAVVSAMAGRWQEFYVAHGLKFGCHGWPPNRAACPLHGGTGPNFAVDFDSGKYYCHSTCGCGGDAIQFVEKLRGIPFTGALRIIGNFAGISNDEDSRPNPGRRQEKSADTTTCTDQLDEFQADAQRFHEVLMSNKNALAHLLMRRGISEESVKHYKLGLKLEKNGDGARFTIPIKDDVGKMSNIRLHLCGYGDITRENPLPKALSIHKGIVADIFPKAMIDWADDLLIVEGEFDAILANQFGVSAITGTAGAATWKPTWTDDLVAAGVKSVCILYDNDDAGQKGAEKAANSIAAAGVQVRVALYPDGVKDLTEWVVDHAGTADDLRGVMDAAPPQGAIRHEIAVADCGPKWPVADNAMFHGVAGDIVRTIEPHTEADNVAILAQLLAMFGNAIGRNVYFKAEDDYHYTNLYVVLVGATSKGRKGTSMGRVMRIMRAIDPNWCETRIERGLTSGEGLIWQVRDPDDKPKKGEKPEKGSPKK